MPEQQLAPLTTEQSFQIASMLTSTRSLAKESRTPDQVWENALRDVLTLMYEKENTYKEMIGKKWGCLPH
jgi:hypothetical protein